MEKREGISTSGDAQSQNVSRGILRELPSLFQFHIRTHGDEVFFFIGVFHGEAFG
jgi:hypothetical protein